VVVAWEADKKGIEERANSRSRVALSLRCVAWGDSIPPSLALGESALCAISILVQGRGVWRMNFPTHVIDHGNWYDHNES